MNIEGSNFFGTLDIAVSGLNAHGKQVEVVGSNIANVRTTDAGDGEPYRRMDAIFEVSEKDGVKGVKVGEILEDKSDFKLVLNPSHPHANADGYVKMPNINYASELIKFNLASRAYQTNAAMLKRYQSMVTSSLELLR